ncbi:MAG: NADPH-dependent FMN reductase [Gammaproteobacteria bacterium CG22_combo_CG10-13_8_21_14_all_40_8]|nr:MAG: NADPH-dependent FMN reductase [Gammaproteobacteria bacterium CG22_combo_CG10-13_8_21_14_all_40_8]
MNIIGFAASNSKQSINKQLVSYALSLIPEANCTVLDLNDFELPLFSEDKEKELGQPELAQKFLAQISSADALVISFAEHNGSYSAAYKNLFDWCSRIQPKVFHNKSMLLLSTSPGARGGASVLTAAVASAPFFGGEVRDHLSIPSFFDNFDMENKCVKNELLNQQLLNAVKQLL